ncbi:MAG TPA: CsiV family protein [Steroidobacteraceae bacterium]
MIRSIRTSMRRAGAVLLAAWLLTSLCAASAQSSDTELQAYEVELVIFSTSLEGATPEDWALEAAEAGGKFDLPDEEPNPFQPSSSPVVSSATFPPLPSSKLKLTAVAQALRRSRNFEPLAHFGWTQPGFPREATQSVRIDDLVPADSGLRGQIALWRGRYLHLTVDLTYDVPATETSPAQRYVMRQTRRMRSNERHYIDHPKFGVIALITAVEQ